MNLRLLRSLDHAGLECSAVRLMPPADGPLLVLGTSGKAGSCYSGLNPTTGKCPTGMTYVRSRRSSPVRPGAANPLTAPGQSRLLLLLPEGLAQPLLLLLGQVGRDDLEVILP